MGEVQPQKEGPKLLGPQKPLMLMDPLHWEISAVMALENLWKPLNIIWILEHTRIHKGKNIILFCSKFLQAVSLNTNDAFNPEKAHLVLFTEESNI